MGVDTAQCCSSNLTNMNGKFSSLPGTVQPSNNACWQTLGSYYFSTYSNGRSGSWWQSAQFAGGSKTQQSPALARPCRELLPYNNARLCGLDLASHRQRLCSEVLPCNINGLSINNAFAGTFLFYFKLDAVGPRFFREGSRHIPPEPLRAQWATVRPCRSQKPFKKLSGIVTKMTFGLGRPGL